MRFRLRTLLIVLALMGVSALLLNPAAKAEEKGLNGRWKIVIAMQGGKPVDDPVNEFVVFMDDRYIQEDERGRVTDKGMVTLDRSVTPVTIDCLSDSRRASLGVFELRGDSLEIFWSVTKRPLSLDSSKDKSFVHVIFVRVPCD